MPASVFAHEGKQTEKVNPFRKPVNFRCPKCNLPLLHSQLQSEHVRFCKGIFVKSMLRPFANRSMTQTTEAIRKIMCEECYKILTNQRDFEIHMAKEHKYSWCYEFKSQDNYRDWFYREGFNEALRLDSKQRLPNGDLHLTYTCTNNNDTNPFYEKCYCRLDIRTCRMDMNTLHVAYYPIHNHPGKFV